MSAGDSPIFAKLKLLQTSTIIRNVLIETLPAGYDFSIHTHLDCEFYMIQSGSCMMEIAGNNVICKENDYLLIMPFIPHSITVPDEMECSFFHMHFDLGFLQNPDYQLDVLVNVNLYEYLTTFAPFYIYGENKLQIKNCLESLLFEYQHQITVNVTLSNFFLFELILLISKDVQKNNKLKMDPVNHFIVQTLKYIEGNYSAKILLDDIADSLNISVRYLSKVFCDKMHMPIASYVSLYRINRAIELMREDYSLTYIAMNVGFSSLPHFTKVFKQRMATTPKMYRKYLLEAEHLEEEMKDFR